MRDANRLMAVMSTAGLLSNPAVSFPWADIDRTSAVALKAIEEVLLRISRVVEEIPVIRELDLNPIFALPPGQGCHVVDARIRVSLQQRR